VCAVVSSDAPLFSWLIWPGNKRHLFGKVIDRQTISIIERADGSVEPSLFLFMYFAFPEAKWPFLRHARVLPVVKRCLDADLLASPVCLSLIIII
jgi:hypothetical protein